MSERLQGFAVRAVNGMFICDKVFRKAVHRDGTSRITFESGGREEMEFWMPTTLFDALEATCWICLTEGSPLDLNDGSNFMRRYDLEWEFLGGGALPQMVTTSKPTQAETDMKNVETVREMLSKENAERERITKGMGK